MENLRPGDHRLHLVMTDLILQMSLQLLCVDRLAYIALVKRDIRCAHSSVRPSPEGAHDLLLLAAEGPLTNSPLAEVTLVLIYPIFGYTSLILAAE